MTQQGQVAEAQKLLRKAVKLAPAHASAHHLLGAVLKDGGQQEEALRSFKRALTYKPDLFDAYTQAAQMLINAEQRRKPWRFTTAPWPPIRDAPNPGSIADSRCTRRDGSRMPVASFDHAFRDEARLLRGAVQSRQCACRALIDTRRQSRASMQRLRSKPELAVPFVNRGNSLLKLARREEALASYEKAALLQNDLPAAHFGRALTLEEMGRFQDAAVVFDHLLTLPMVRGNATFTARLRARRAAILVELGRTEEARADADAALGLAPDDDEVLYHVSNLDLSGRQLARRMGAVRASACARRRRTRGIQAAAISTLDGRPPGE